MSILDRYIAQSIIYSTFLVMGVLLSLFAFIQFVDVLGDIGRAKFGLYDAGRYLLLSLPRQLYELFPMAALLGTTLGLASLAVDSELVAMRAAGVSLLRIVGSAMKVGVLLALVALAIGELVAPVTSNMAERGRSSALQTRIKQQKDSGLWLRDGQSFVHVSEVLPDLSLLRINIYEFDPSQQLRLQTYAASGVYQQEAWLLRDVSHSSLEDGRVRTKRSKQERWTSVLAPDVLSVFAVKPEMLSAWHLRRYIQHLEQNKQDTGRYALAFWHKLVSPLATVVMMVLAIPFVFGQVRSGGVGSRLFIGIMLGLAFFVLNRGFGYFGLLYGIPPPIGAVLPTLLFFGFALVMLRRAA